MIPRNGLMAVTGLIAVSGLAAAAPPINPFIEGREPNPVVREFYETEKPVSEYRAGPVIPAQSKSDWITRIVALGESLLNLTLLEFDIPHN